jgi:hypothetical protein
MNLHIFPELLLILHRNVELPSFQVLGTGIPTESGGWRGWRTLHTRDILDKQNSNNISSKLFLE